MKYMAFPVLGQVLGVVMIFAPLYFFTENIESVVASNPIYENISMVFLTVLLLVIPGFVVLLKAFWDYLVSFASLNSMASNLISGAKLEDLKIHNDTVYRRYGTYVLLILILSLICALAIIPILLALILIFMIYLTFVFQVFALDEGLSAVEVIKKSIKSVKGNSLMVSMLLVLLFAFTYWFLPLIIAYGFEKTTLLNFLVVPIETYFKTLPFDALQSSIQALLPQFKLDVYDLSYQFLLGIISSIVIGFTLPLRSICCMLLYKNLEVKELKAKKIKEL